MLARSRPFVNIDTLVGHLQDGKVEDEKITQFENAFATYMGVPRAIATTQARAGLFFALKSLNLTPRHEVLVQSFTYYGVVNAILEAGLRPVFVDNSLEDLNAHAENFSQKITKNTKVIIATHLFGIPTDIPQIKEIADENNCILIEDCAQSLGPKYDGKKTGTYGDFSIVSFNFEKHISTGEGGVLLVNHRDRIAEIERVIQQYKKVPEFDEKCYVYGLIALFLATDPEMYITGLTAYFGQDCCKKDPQFFNALDTCIRNGDSEEQIRKVMQPHLKKAIVPIHTKYLRSLPAKNSILRNLVSAAVWAKHKIYYKKPEVAKINREHLLMNKWRAVAGLAGLETVTEVNRTRNEHARMVQDLLEGKNDYMRPHMDQKKESVYLKYSVLRTSPLDLAALFRHARVKGFELGNDQWPLPVHKREEFAGIVPPSQNDLKNSEYIAQRVINIPVHYYVSEADIQEMVSILTK